MEWQRTVMNIKKHSYNKTFKKCSTVFNVNYNSFNKKTIFNEMTSYI